jgi:choline kinase
MIGNTRNDNRYKEHGAKNQPSRIDSVHEETEIRPQTDIILFSAGMGRRLGLDVPKCLAPICGKPLLYWQIRTLREGYPWSRIIVVTGSRYETVRTVLSEQFDELSDNVVLVHNPFVDCSGIMGSAWFGLQYCTKQWVLRLDGDLLFTAKSGLVTYSSVTPTLFTSVMRKAVENPTPVIRDNQISLQPRYVGKNAWMCAELYSRSIYDNIVTNGLDLVAKGHYFEAMNRWLANHAVHCEVVNQCVEIDTREDYERAQCFWRRQGF